MFRTGLAVRWSSTFNKPLLYNRLQITTTATLDEIKKAYRKRVLECHPDTITDPKEKTGAEAEFRLLCEAYETLKDETSRAAYDRSVGVTVAVAVKEDGEHMRGGWTPKRRRKADDLRSSLDEELKSKIRSRKAAAQYGFSEPEAQEVERGERPVVSSGRGVYSTGRKFLRKDADRVFGEEFGGKTLHDLLFQARLDAKRQQVGHRPARRHRSLRRGGDEVGKEEPKPASEQQQSSQHAATMDAVNAAAAAFRLKNPFVNPREIRLVQSRHREEAPNEYPSEKIPFRPFPGMNLPKHVLPENGHIPAAPKPEFLADTPVVLENSEGNKEVMVMKPATISPDQLVEGSVEPEVIPRSIRQKFHLYSTRPLGVDDIYVKEDALRRLEQNWAYPHGLGMVYSFHRIH